MSLRWVLALLFPAFGSSVLAATRQPVWSVPTESVDLADWSPGKPFAIPEKHLVVFTTQSRKLVAIDVATGKPRWTSKAHVQHINGFDAATITVEGVSQSVAIVDTSTGAVVEQLTSEQTHDIVPVHLGGVVYGVMGSRKLIAAKGDKLLWTDLPGFIPEVGVLPEVEGAFVILRGTMAHARMGFLRVYAQDSGKLLWDVESEAENRDDVVMNAQVAGDRAVVLREGILTSRELATGRVIWSERSDQIPVVTPSRVLAFDKETVKVLDARSGKTVSAWKRSVGVGSTIATVAEGVIYASQAKAVSTLGGTKYDCWLVAVDERSGRELWRSDVDRRTLYARPIVIDDKVVLVSRDRIYAMKIR